MSRAKGRNQIIAKPENLVAALVSACQEYTDEVKETVKDGIIKIGEEAVAEVKFLSPVYKGDDTKRKYPNGSYRDSWTYHVDQERGKIQVTVHAKRPHYRLTHLLEYGHALKDGTGRKYGEVGARPHISIANANAEKKVDKLLEEL